MSETLVRHIVLIKYKEGTDKAAASAAIAKGIAGMKDAIPEMLAYQAGADLALDPERNHDFAIQVDFASPEAYAVYATHPVHQKVIADVQAQAVATVRVARPLPDAEVDRLAAALTAQYGRPVHLNLLVDPSVLGGIRVEIGDDVIDGTVSSRLDDARRRLVG